MKRPNKHMLQCAPWTARETEIIYYDRKTLQPKCAHKLRIGWGRKIKNEKCSAVALWVRLSLCVYFFPFVRSFSLHLVVRQPLFIFDIWYFISAHFMYNMGKTVFATKATANVFVSFKYITVRQRPFCTHAHLTPFIWYSFIFVSSLVVSFS